MWLIVFSCLSLVGSAFCAVYGTENYVLPLWVFGLTLALLWGFKDWWKTRRIDWFDIGWTITIYALALFLRVGFDLRGLPAFVDNDELHLLGESAKLAVGKYKLLDTFWVGIPLFGLFPQALIFQFMEPNILSSRIGEAIFGALAVVAVYDLGRTLVNRRVGMAAAFLVAVAHESIHWARVGMPFILVSTFAAIMMAFAVRAVKGGTHLSWVGAALATGFGMISYQAGYFLPVFLCASSLPLVIGATKGANRWRAVGIYCFICLLGALVASPPLLKILTTVSWGDSRPATLLISKESLPNLANTYGIPRTPTSDVVAHHVTKSVTLLWNGADAWSQYGARYPLVDPVTGAALVLLPLALLFGNRVVAWLSLTWIVGYLVMGVLLVGTPPTYHRISTIVIFAALAAATMVDWIAPKRLKSLALTAFCVASAYCNLNFYFNTYPKQRLPEFSSVIARIMAPFKDTHEIVDASSAGIVTPEQKSRGALVYHNELLGADLPGAKIVEVLNKNETWTLGEARGSKILVIARTEAITEMGVHPPSGYTVGKMWEDRSIGAPEPVSLTIVELVKKPS
jgi:hypothetical protein